MNVSERCKRSGFFTELPLAVIKEDPSWDLSRKGRQTSDWEPKFQKLDRRSWKETLHRLDLTRGQVDFDTCASLLQCIGNAKALSDGKRLHHHIMKCGLGKNKFLGSRVLQMYIKCGALEEAHDWFVKMDGPNVHSWNFMIWVYAKDDNCKEACQLFEEMQREGVLPDKVTFLYVLSACASQAALAKGKQLHTCIINNRFESDIVVGTALLTMYGKCGSLANARGEFDSILDRDVVCWNAMITAYAQRGHSKEALEVFDMMQQEGITPNRATFASILDALAGQVAIGQLMHGHITWAGLEADIVLVTALINMYGKCGNLGNARGLFHRSFGRDTILWNTMIVVCVQHGHYEEALQLFGQMQSEGMIADQVTFVSIFYACANPTILAEGKRMHARILCHGFDSDKVLVTAIINMYGKCSELEEAKRVFDRVEKRDVFLWTAIIAAYVQLEKGQEALQVFKQMQNEGVVPDKVTYVTILPACTCQVALIEGENLHAQLSCNGFESDVQIANALITMYGKYGNFDSARKMFDKMMQRDVVSWNAIIAAHAQHGHGHVALQLHSQMQQQGITPDEVTYVSVLSACSHAGLVDEGCCLFSMIQDYGIMPNLEHYGCMIDLLGRAGQLEEAENLLKNMQCIPTSVPWMTLLGACRNRIDVERGEHAAMQVFKLDPNNATPYIMLWNLYTIAGKDDDAKTVMNMMSETGLKE